MIQFQDIIIQRRKDLQRTMELKPLKDLKDEIESADKRGNKKILDKNVDPRLKGTGKASAKTKGQNFEQSIKNTENVRVICEYKPASPSMGDISSTPLEKAIDVFESAGASAVSVLTEENYFKGSLNNLKAASRLTELPLIRKDFLVNEYQIYEAKLAGASAVLLMSGIYPDMQGGLDLSRNLGMEALVECKSREDIENALKSGAHVIGINNRDFKDFTVDLERTRKLAVHVPQDVVLVSESGVKSPEDAKLLASYGADAILVGTGIMGAYGKSGMLTSAQRIIDAVEGLKIQRVQK
jgi:indole-3-glycerol phosphate synthase